MKKKTQTTQQNKILEGTRLNYNYSLQLEYVAAIKKLLKPMINEVTAEVEKFFRKPVAKEFYAAMDASVASQGRILTDKLLARFENLLPDKSEKIIKKMIKESSKVSAATLGTSLKKVSGGITLKTDILTGPLKEQLKAAVTENVSLIKTITTQYLTNVQKQVMRSITTGNGLADLIPALQKYEGITYRHAKNMALDQTRKVYNTLNRARMEKRGVKKFKWLHSGGGLHPRQEHIDMNGKIYSFDNLPVIDKKTGERGIPGQAINCKCTMSPVIDFED